MGCERSSDTVCGCEGKSAFMRRHRDVWSWLANGVTSTSLASRPVALLYNMGHFLSTLIAFFVLLFFFLEFSVDIA